MEQQRSFSSWQIIIVLAVLAALVGFGYWAVANQSRLSRDYKRVADINQIKAALTLYHADLSRYPDKVEEGGQIMSEVDGTVYMQQVPGNPQPGGSPYAYQVSEDRQSYTMAFVLEGDVGELKAGTHTTDPTGIK
ncbi:MAG: hypothetical protein V1707_01400 [bacterium]